MAENLNYFAGDSQCYGTSAIENCTKYGRLYDWATAMQLPPSCNTNSCSDQIQEKHRGVCPFGWHLPSSTEWENLMVNIGGTGVGGVFSAVGTKLKTKDDWNSNCIGEDTYGFSAMPGGRTNNGVSDGLNSSSYWWTTTKQTSTNNIYFFSMDCSWNLNSVSRNTTSGLQQKYSVRCLKD